MTVHLYQSAKDASCPNQQEHTTVVSVTGESMLCFFCSGISLIDEWSDECLANLDGRGIARIVRKCVSARANES